MRRRKIKKLKISYFTFWVRFPRIPIVRFDGWQWTNSGEREVKQALRKTLLKYKLHKEQDLFDRAYAYIRQYY